MNWKESFSRMMGGGYWDGFEYKFPLSKGFTLSELILVLVLIGIMSAYLVMRFGGLGDSARVVAVKALAGRVRVAADTVYNLSVAQGTDTPSGGTVRMRDGSVVRVVHGFPVAADNGIKVALTGGAVEAELDLEGVSFSASGGVGTFERRDARKPGLCKVDYIYHTEQQTTPKVVVDVSDCR